MRIPARFLASKLVDKSLLRVHGRESLPYLQTFLTNDIRHVTPGSGKHCLYSHIINSMGRTLADVFVYQPGIPRQEEPVQRNLVLAPFYSNDFGRGGLETDEVILECSNSIAGGLERALFAMKIRKKVTIEPIHDKQIWVIFPENIPKNIPKNIPETSSRERLHPPLLHVSSQVLLVSDPRITGLGYRLIVPSSWTIDSVREVIESTIKSTIKSTIESTIESTTQISESTIPEYDRHRYRMGVSEGAREHGEGVVFPLECNGDLLNGVSLKKGMFSGDWITGRNYRKGVMSRIVPFELESCDLDQLRLVAPASTLIHPVTHCIMGEIRARRGNIGLASLPDRFLDRNGDISFTHYSTSIRGRSWIPHWWPHSVQRVNEKNIPDGRRNPSIIPERQR